MIFARTLSVLVLLLSSALIRSQGQNQKNSPQTGTVLVSLVVDKEGKPTDLKIARSSGSPDMDKKLLEAARNYRFKTSAYKVKLTIEIAFKINPASEKAPSSEADSKATPQ